MESITVNHPNNLQSITAKLSDNRQGIVLSAAVDTFSRTLCCLYFWKGALVVCTPFGETDNPMPLYRMEYFHNFERAVDSHGNTIIGTQDSKQIESDELDEAAGVRATEDSIRFVVRHGESLSIQVFLQVGPYLYDLAKMRLDQESSLPEDEMEELSDDLDPEYEEAVQYSSISVQIGGEKIALRG